MVLYNRLDSDWQKTEQWGLGVSEEKIGGENRECEPKKKGVEGNNKFNPKQNQSGTTTVNRC